MKKVKEGYKMTELGEIPSEWEIKSIGEIFDFSGGLSISRAKLTDKGVNYLHYGDIHMRNENYIDTDKDEAWLPKIEDNFEEIKENVKLNSGDVVFADASEDYEGIGKSVAIFNDFEKPFVAGLHTIVAKDINNQLENNYKRYCFSTNEVRKQFRYLATGTSVYGISRENIKKIKINIPTIKEQEKIASILSTVDEQIDNVDALIEKNKQLKKGLMQILLTKGIGHTKFKKTEIGEIPEEWEVRRLEDICDDITIGMVKTMTKFYVDNGVPLIRNSDIKENTIKTDSMVYLDKEFSRANQSKCLNIGQIVTVHTGDIGTSAVIEENMQGAQGFATLNTTVNKSIINEYYLCWYLNSDICKNQAYSFSTGDGRNNLNLKDFINILVIVPSSIDEQKKIVFILNSISRKIQEYENKKQKLEELKKGLMQQLLTGKIRVV